MLNTVRIPQRAGWRKACAVCALLLLVGGLSACFNSDKAGNLFGSPGDGGGNPGLGNEYQQGQGGGFILRNLFLRARLATGGPQVLRTFPEDRAQDITLRSQIVVTFSESITQFSATGAIRLFPDGNNTPVQGTTDLLHGQSVVVFTPSDQLLPDTVYELVVNANVADLQGQPLEDENGQTGTEARFRFTTTAQNSNPPFVVTETVPVGNSSNVVRGTELTAFFSEPVNAGLSGGGIFNPAVTSVLVNGAVLSPDDYTLVSLGGAQIRGINIVADERFPADAEVELRIAEALEASDGQSNLGNGLRLSVNVQNVSEPTGFNFPDQLPVEDASGFVSVANINELATEVTRTADGESPDEIVVFFYDQQAENTLLFLQQDPANPLAFNADLQPDDSTVALADGEVVIAAYSRRRQFRSAISVIGVMQKDTVGPRLETLGPPLTTVGVPPFSFDVLYTNLRESVLVGRMDEPCRGVSFEFDGEGELDFNTVQLAPGLSTVTENFFITAPSEDAPLVPSTQPQTSTVVIGIDQFGNGSAGFDTATVGVVGVTGAQTPDAADTTALTVVAYARDDFHAIGTGAGDFGMVVVDEFPPSDDGANRVVKGMAAGLSMVEFSEAELNAIPGTRLTVSVVANGYLPLSYVGLDKPSAASPNGLLPLLSPETAESRSQFDPTLVGVGQGSRTLVGATDFDLDITTMPVDRMIDLPSPFTLNDGRVHMVSGRIENPPGSGSFRFAVTEPAGVVSGGGSSGSTLTRPLDFTGRPTYNSSTPNVLSAVSFTDADASTGGSLGLLGTEADQYRRLRFVAKVPGFAFPLGVSRTDGSAFTGFGTADPDRIASAFLPSGFLTNDSVDETGVEDSFLELLLQPSLIDAEEAVDLDRLNDRVLLELHLEDVVDPGDSSSSRAFTRQRLRRTEPLAASLQAIPSVSATDTTHPPMLQWMEVTAANNAVHRLNVTEVGGRRWSLLVPPGTAGANLDFQLPAVPVDFTDVSPLGPSATVDFEFGVAGDFVFHVESFDFDPASGAALYTFDMDSFFQTDLELEHFFLSRSDPDADAITTN